MSLLGDWEAWQAAAGLSERTITERTGVIQNLCGSTGAAPETLTPRDIIRFVGRRELTASSKATYHASIRAFTAWCVKTGVCADDPAQQTPKPKRPKNTPRPISPQQFEALLAVANRRRTIMMILLAALAGLRIHEVAKIHGHDVDFHTGVLTIVGKGGATKTLPLHPEIIAVAKYFPTNDWWFPAYDGKDGPVRPGAVGKAITRALTRAGVHATPHQLRHFFGTSLLDSGADLRTVQELMRHESIQSTQIYTDVSAARKAAAISRLRTVPLAHAGPLSTAC